MSMSDSTLNKSFSSINSSQGIFVKEDSMSGSTPDKCLLNFSQDDSKIEDFKSMSCSVLDKGSSFLSCSILSFSFLSFFSF